MAIICSIHNLLKLLLRRSLSARHRSAANKSPKYTRVSGSTLFNLYTSYLRLIWTLLQTGILLMDEPFGALDEQTRMILGEDLSLLLARANKTIVFVTHSLGEATFLADRVAVFSARPGSIKQLIAVDEPHPRKPEFVTSPKFATIRNALYGLLHDEIRKTMAETGIAVGRPR